MGNRGPIASTLLFFTPPKRATELKDLINQENEVGTTLFGPVSPNAKRDFFYLDKNTWVWNEEYEDQAGVRHKLNTRYEIQSNGVFKVQNGHRSLVAGQELENFTQAARWYYRNVSESVYGKHVAA